MSATSGVVCPADLNASAMSPKRSASFLLGAVMRTNSQPASIIRMLWATVPGTSMVSVVVMDCTRMGLSPPNANAPMRTSRVERRR